MKARLFLFGLLLLPLLLPAQNRPLHSDKFSVGLSADWNPSFTGTYHYYLDDDDNKVWHGSAVVNQTKSHKDDLYAWGEFIDSYSDTRTYKVNANYKHGHLDGAFSLSYSVKVTLRVNRDNNISLSLSISGRYNQGLLDGNWKLVTSGRQGSNKAASNISIVFDKGHLTKYTEHATINGNTDRDIDITIKDDSIVTGSIVSSDINITLVNGFTTDYYYALNDYRYECSNSQMEIVQKLANGELSIDDLADMGYMLRSSQVSNVNENLMGLVDKGLTNFEYFLGKDDQMFSSLGVGYSALAEAQFTSYDEFLPVLKRLTPDELVDLQNRLSSRNVFYYELVDYRFSPATVKRILNEIPALKADAEKQMRLQNRSYLEEKIKSVLSDCRVEIQEVDFRDDGQVESASFRVYQNYSSGFGFSIRQCSIANNSSNEKFPSSDLVKYAFDQGSLVHNEWDDVQSLYAKVFAHHDKVMRTIGDASFVDMKKSYSLYFSDAIPAASRTDVAAAQTDLSAIFDEQNRYLRLVELRKVLLANNDIIVNMDVKHGDNIKDAYYLYWNTLNKDFVKPSQSASLQNAIDVQTGIIAALRSENLKKLDRKVKKSDDKSIQTVLQLLQSE